MTKEQIKFLREKFKDKSLYIIGDNMKLYHFDSDKAKYTWDDEHEILFAVQTNTNAKEQKYAPYIMEAIPYDMIQYMSVHVKNLDV